MKPKLAAAVLVICLGAALVFATSAAASEYTPPLGPEPGPDPEPAPAPGPADLGEGAMSWEPPPANYPENWAAFLKVIRIGESNDDYTALVYRGAFGGPASFSGFDDHPALLGWPGVRRPDDARLTTAAGAYQIVRSTWVGLGGKAKYGSFDPQAQTRAAVDLIVRRPGAASAVERGDIPRAVAALRNEWEFFQKWPVERVAREFVKHGGTLA